jgi:hypothetical protein
MIIRYKMAQSPDSKIIAMTFQNIEGQETLAGCQWLTPVILLQFKASLGK